MISFADLLSGELADFVLGFLAVFFRVGAMVAVLPGFGTQLVPARVTIAVALCLSIAIAPAVPNFVEAATLSSVFWLLLTETANGLIIGFGLRLFFITLQTAGSIAANTTSLAQILGGASSDPLPAISFILLMGGLALSMTLGLHVVLAQFLLSTYALFPAGRLPGGQVLSSWGVHQVSQSFSLAFSLAAPFAIVSFTYNIALGAINRAMPQLMVAFVGAPLITLIGLFVFLASAPLMLSIWADVLAAFVGNPLSEAR